MILGDMNIDLYKIKANDPYFQALLSNGMKSLISFPTRVERHTETLIDHALANFTLNNCNVVGGTIINDISDHFSTFAIFPKTLIPIRNPSNSLRQRFSFKNYDRDEAQLLIHDESWEDVINKTNVNEAYNTFLDKLQQLQAQVIQTVAEKDKKEIHQPWMTKGIRKAQKRRYKLFKK